MPFTPRQPARAAARRGLLLLLTVSVVSALAALMSGCNRPSPSPPDQADQAPVAETPEVRVVKPEKKDVRRRIERPGYNVEAYERTPLYAKLAGYVRKWNADLGDRVHQGD